MDDGKVSHHNACNGCSLNCLPQSWEYGIPLCKELASVYEKRIAFDKLSKLLQMQSQYYVNILNETRPNPEYFKVGFFGQGFPPFLRNKEFVYRGRPLEKISSFQKRLLEEFDQSKCVSGAAPVDDALRQHPGQFLQLCPLRPVPSLDPAMSTPDVPNAVRNFYLVNEVDTFQSDRPFHDGVKDPQNDFRSLHVDRTTVRIAQKLPGVLKWFEVTECSHKILTPIEVAIDAMGRVNQKLQNLILRFSSPDAESSLNPMTMRLNSVMDAAVNGGIVKYERAFFAGNPDDMAQEYRQHVSTLREVFLDQVRILGSALALHKRLIPKEFNALHEHLETMYARLKRGIKETVSSSGKLHNQPLPPSLSDRVLRI
ncbi:hypothetical protein CAPTEDRAFT_97079 [Capitella teleta]|uniref:DOCKER domain-containing protein n=1 Tax=Capitella teleta TaxID=283909 RepID=R7UP59_CAPTE|nr:hypothetical protein CAPTEDRAFT_97079 [Capitella teleta]|eukprot:ELU05722.1 hypothetical protein CAPTEDRAFT_97079 [Capitella teleta]